MKSCSEWYEVGEYLITGVASRSFALLVIGLLMSESVMAKTRNTEPLIGMSAIAMVKRIPYMNSETFIAIWKNSLTQKL
jgi:hypothetical protein